MSVRLVYFQSEAMSEKKTGRSVLGPRGRRKLGLAKGENYKDPGGHQSGYLGSQVRERKMLDQEGFDVKHCK